MTKKRRKTRKKAAPTGRVTVSRTLLAKATSALAAVKRTAKTTTRKKTRKKARRKAR